jgi:hypothetical protein
MKLGYLSVWLITLTQFVGLARWLVYSMILAHAKILLV